MAKTGDKRKASLAGPKGSPKKPKLEVQRKPLKKGAGGGSDGLSDSGGFSDSEDGGAKVQPPKKFEKKKGKEPSNNKGKGKPNGEELPKAFERGE